MRKKYIATSLIILSAIILMSFSNIDEPKPGNIQIKPVGFSTNGFRTYCLLGMANAYLEYEEPGLNIKEPTHLPKLEGITYSEILLSGIKSLLFEYKNYEGEKGMSAYSLFALGNYNVINDQLLDYANKKVLNNQKMLQLIYNWLLPYYKKGFNSITVEEQMVMMNNLKICEQYVNMVLEKRDNKSFNLWIKSNKYTVDEKTIGFLKRRVSKKQWTIADCKKWITRLKTDFTPLVKNKNKAASHYQITDTINNNLFIAVNHKGEYGLIDNYFNVKEDFRYTYINRKNDLEYHAYTELSYYEFDILSPQDY
jgi:hypothetical protein